MAGLADWVRRQIVVGICWVVHASHHVMTARTVSSLALAESSARRLRDCHTTLRNTIEGLNGYHEAPADEASRASWRAGGTSLAS